MTRSVLAFAVILVVSTATFAGRQDQQPKPAFKSGIDLVHFDVSVLDKNRRPVRGLTAADFTVLEDGKPQPIAAFLAVDVPPPAPPPAAKWMREVSPDVQTNEPEQNPEGRLFVLLIDDALMPPDPVAVQNAKKIAHGVVDRLSPTDQVAVVFTFASGGAQTFTTDRKKALAAIDSLQTGKASHLMGWNNAIAAYPRGGGVPEWTPTVDDDAGLRLGSLRTLQMVADTLIAAPQRRKAMIFVSSGITVDLASDAQPVKANPYDVGQQVREMNHQLAREMPEVLGRMARANVTVYSVDPFGLGGLEPYITAATSGLQALKSGVDPPPFYNWLAPKGVAPKPSALAHHTAAIDLDFLMAAAANTGGRAIVNTNDFDPGLDGIFEENASYYLIGYARPEKNAPGSLHRVTMKVNRPGVTVRTRSGYGIEPARKGANAEPVALALSEAAAGPVAAGALPLQIALAPIAAGGGGAGGGKDNAAVAIVLGLRQPAVIERTPQSIDVQIGVYTPDGRRVGDLKRQTAAFRLVPTGGDVVRYDVLTQVPLAPGRYEMRVAAYRATDSATGSVYADVVVPDFAKAPLSASGVFLEANPGPSALPRDGLASLVPVVPTSSRTFANNDQVTAFFRVYQGGGWPLVPVSFTSRIVNSQDVVVSEAGGTIGAERFDAATRAADHRYQVPLRGLAPGSYLLSFELTAGETTARRDVVFSVGNRSIDR